MVLFYSPIISLILPYTAFKSIIDHMSFRDSTVTEYALTVLWCWVPAELTAPFRFSQRPTRTQNSNQIPVREGASRLHLPNTVLRSPAFWAPLFINMLCRKRLKRKIIQVSPMWTVCCFRCSFTVPKMKIMTELCKTWKLLLRVRFNYF